MTGAMFEWKAFTLKISICKSLTGLTGDAASYVIRLGKEVFEILFSTHREGVNSLSEKCWPKILNDW